MQSSAWCTSGGTTGSAANTTDSAELSFTDNNPHSVGVDLTGLTQGVEYCARLIATNADGEGDGGQLTWLEASPVVNTTDAVPISAAQATVNGNINPLGQDTVYWAEYGLADSTWCTSHGTQGPAPESADSQQLHFTDNTAHDVSVKLFQLTTGAEYCARLAALSTGGEGSGNFVTFTVNKAGAVTGSVSSTGGPTATAAGVVNPNGQTTTYEVQYDVAGSAWCTSGGASGSPAQATDPATLGFTDEEFHEVSVDLTRLTPPTEYCARLVATNVNGEVDGSQVTWTQGIAPDAATFDTFSTGATTATVEGFVDLHAEETTYLAEYDTADSEWCTSGGTSGSATNTTSATSDGLDPTSTDYQYVAVDLSGLSEGQDYCAQIVASNPNGDSDGGQVWWTQGAPTTDTFDASPTGTTTATVDGDVNPAGSATTYWVEYDAASSDWCQSGGLSGSPAGASVPTAVDPVDDQFHQVSVALTGLDAGTDYCGDVVAMNQDGTSESFQVSWTQETPPPPRPTLTVNRSGLGSGIVTSSPTGLDCGTTCSAQFDSGTQVTLTASAAVGSTFAGWSGGGCSGPGTCKVTLNADTVVTAIFTPAPPVTLTVSVVNPGLGSVSSSPAGIDCGATCSHLFPAGTQVTLTAVAAGGTAYLQSWSGGGCSGTGSCVVTLNGDTTVTASFATGPKPPPAPQVKCIVPKLKHKTLAAAKRAIKKAHCAVGKVTRVKSTTKNKGRVISQKPKPGRHLRKGSKVALKVGT